MNSVGDVETNSSKGATWRARRMVVISGKNSGAASALNINTPGGEGRAATGLDIA